MLGTATELCFSVGDSPMLYLYTTDSVKAMSYK